MSMVEEPVLAKMWSDLSLTHLTDGEWLQALAWRRSTEKQLVEAAKAGDSTRFGRALTETLFPVAGQEKKQAVKVLQTLRLLWNRTDHCQAESELPSLESCLFEDISQLPAVLFQNVEEAPTEETLITALWILNLQGPQLEPETSTFLWRWTLQHTQKWMHTAAEPAPEGGFKHLLALEHRLLAALTYRDLKGGNKLLKSIVKLLRKSLEEAIDGDGTPHAQWVADMDSILLRLARTSLLAHQIAFRLWDAKSLKLLQHFFDRVASLYYADTCRAFGQQAMTLSASQLDHVAELFELEKDSGLRMLFRSWSKAKGNAKPINTWLLPEECHQSDWAEWACLRSTWSSPVDQCHVTHHLNMPQIDVVTKDVSLFRGDWNIQLDVNGKSIEWADDWACVCWFSDEEASFVELQQEVNDVRVLRQVTLLREENMLLLADSISSKVESQLDYTMTLPLSGGWQYEADSWTRELALQHQKQRVRVFPISSPQTRVENGDGKLTMANNEFSIHQSAKASGMYVATVFDWSGKRAKKPVDWSRLTVAENGDAVRADSAAGYRIRIGKSQWLLYHSLKNGHFPRSVLGYHTGQETILARVESDGEVTPVVEVARQE